MDDQDQGVWHTVEQGEWLNSIVREAGVGDPERVWNHPKNANLAARREKEVLFPGDKLYLPAPQPRQESCDAGQRHVFQVPTIYDTFQVNSRIQTPGRTQTLNIDLYWTARLSKEQPMVMAACELRNSSCLREPADSLRFRQSCFAFRCNWEA